MLAPGGAWLLWGACVVAPGGACMVAPVGVRDCSWGGMHGFFPGGMHGFSWGAFMVFPGGHSWLSGGHAWFFSRRGMCRIRRDTVNERAVCNLLECILVIEVSVNSIERDPLLEMTSKIEVFRIIQVHSG